jgi:hypothetical protein
LSHEDRKEELRRRYIKLHGPTTSDEFIGFMMTAAFQDFVREHGSAPAWNAAVDSHESVANGGAK